MRAAGRATIRRKIRKLTRQHQSFILPDADYNTGYGLKRVS